MTGYEMKTINIDFINEWEKQYDIHETDEEEYKSILNQTRLEIEQAKLISKKTFASILDWKSPRLKGIVKLNDYESIYNPVLKACFEEISNENKIRKIISLYGISIPTGTTILHFVYPDIFPIMDIRTAETLYSFGYLKHKSRTENNYSEFYRILHQLKNDTAMSFRKIDRALFSFHKNNMKNLVNENNQRTIDSYISDYHNMSNEEFMLYLANEYIIDEYQKNIFLSEGVWTKVRLNYIAGLLLSQRNTLIFTPKEIREIIREEIIPSISELNDEVLSSLILTSDVHFDAKQEYNNGYPCLAKIGHGKYKFLGFSNNNNFN